MVDSRKTPIFDWETGEFKTDSQGRVLTATGGEALEQVVIKASSTPRGIFLIYADPVNPEKNHKYGTDVPEIMTRKNVSEDVRISEIKRAIREALVYDPWITDVQDINAYESIIEGVKGRYADYTLTTVFDNELYVKGAVIDV